ncbi:unnamed protein product [Lactuca saligna]|uniref:Uncharacterized protein n=1 Tax=Lactuca saligna TaxID=75948 RepID=A0AA35VEQ9_LACSI|nr:unnamed protein product [Lactuca saligna]
MQGIKDPTLKVPIRNTFTSPNLLPLHNQLFNRSFPKLILRIEEKKVIFKTKNELAKEAQMETYEELAKQLMDKELKSKQEAVIKKKSSEISPEERNSLQPLRQYVLDMVIDFIVDWEIGQVGENEADEPDLDLNMENESPGNILKKPHKGVVFSSKG